MRKHEASHQIETEQQVVLECIRNLPKLCTPAKEVIRWYLRQ